MSRQRPWILPVSLACLPPSLTLVGALTAPPGAGQLAGGGSARLAALAALLGAAALVGLFAWLTLWVPQVAMFRRRSMRFKRLLVAGGSLLTSSAFWMSVVVGDVAWRSVLVRGSPGEGALALSGWTYLFLTVGLALGIYIFARPRRLRSG